MSLDPSSHLVFDASAAINFLGTGLAARLLDTIDQPVIMAGRTFKEISRHPLKGRDHAIELQSMRDSGRLQVHELDDKARELFFELTSEDVPGGLDDGEAAAIALAVSMSGPVALALDDQKARNILSQRWPDVHSVFTVELLADQRIYKGIAPALHSEVVHSALIHARMRVPRHCREWVLQLIGGERAAQCRSIGMGF